MGIGAGTAGLIAAGVGAAGAVGSSLISSGASKTAGGQAAAGDQGGAAIATGALGNITNALTPYTNLGINSTGALQSAITNGTYQTPQLSQQQLDATPGYQFTLQQGLESTQNSAAARGLANSGAALKGAATYATGLANDTYQNQFQDQLAANNQNFNQLLSGTQLGETAANQYGEYATQAAQTAAGLASGAGQAQASGTTGSASAINSGLSGLSSSTSQGLLLSQLLGGTGNSTLLSQLGGGYSNSGWQ